MNLNHKRNQKQQTSNKENPAAQELQQPEQQEVQQRQQQILQQLQQREQQPELQTKAGFLTAEKLMEFPGFEEISIENAAEIVNSLVLFSQLTYELFSGNTRKSG